MAEAILTCPFVGKGTLYLEEIRNQPASSLVVAGSEDSIEYTTASNDGITVLGSLQA